MMDKIKELRELTGAGIMDAKRAIEEVENSRTRELKGDEIIELAKKIIEARGLAKAAKKSDRSTAAGRVYSYIHATGKVGAMVEIACETDFVADNADFVTLCKEVAMQIASMNPAGVEELLAMDYIRDGSKKIEDLVKALIAKTGENMKIVRFSRFELGN